MRWAMGGLVAFLGAQTLMQQADSLRQAGKYAEAFVLYDSLVRQGGGSDSVRLRAYIGGAECLAQQRKVGELEAWAAKGAELSLKLRDTNSWVAVQAWVGGAYFIMGRYSAAEGLWDTLMGVLGRLGRMDSVVYAGVGHLLATAWYYQGSYEAAESLFKKVIQIRRRKLGPEHPHYLASLNNLANAYSDQGRYVEAESLYKVVAGVQHRVLGGEHPDYLSSLNNLAVLYDNQGRYVEAESLYKVVAGVQYRVLGGEHPDYLGSLHNLAIVYGNQGRYIEAESLHRVVAGVQYRVLGGEHPMYLISLNSIATMYYEQGRYIEAESLYKAVTVIQYRVLGGEHPAYLSSLNNLASLYDAQGRYVEAESLHKVVAGACYRMLGGEHPDYLRSLNNLALVYYNQGRYVEAESLFKVITGVQHRVLGMEHPDYLRSLHNLASLYNAQGRYVQAESLHKLVAEVRYRMLGREHAAYLHSLNNLANVYHHQGRYAAAESLFRVVTGAWYRALGGEHPDYLIFVNGLALVCAPQGKYGVADSLWGEVIRGTFGLIRREFVGLAGAHQLAFLENNLMRRFAAFQRYVGDRGAASPGLLQLGYRAARSVKGLVLSSVEGLRYLAEQSRDSVTQALYRQWLRLTQQYAALMLREDYEQAGQVQKEAEAVEAELAQRLPEVRSFLPDIEREGDPALRRGEAVVEIVRIADKDTVWYLYYILTSGRCGVDIRLLVRRIGLAEEERWERVYELLRSPGVQVTGKAYELLWAPVDSVLPRGIRRVYVSPDGVYYRVNVATLYDGRRYMIERYGVSYVATSRRLVVTKRRGEGRRPVVVGGPDFGGEAPAGQPARGSRFFPYGIPPLPEAEAEARAVAQLLGVEAVTGAVAREEVVKGAVSPRVLHIATHGYYDAGARSGLLGSGLLFAGAAMWDSVYPPAGVEDGRLTAKEASGMNLLGTDLVVLSACETGLGEIKGEGLYGLQRAFLEAGASRVMAALWQVDDAATRAFMEAFYRGWGEAGWKAEAIDAVYEATVRAFRQQYPQPYHWGAFVLMR
ncbi:MAG: CHAT domain-containing protein [Bacteroidia bacterium]|nr:CHAT domain-containing protein [Bacteroidia bacterium]